HQRRRGPSPRQVPDAHRHPLHARSDCSDRRRLPAPQGRVQGRPGPPGPRRLSQGNTPKENTMTNDLADALDALADRMEAHAGPLNVVGFASLTPQLIDGPGASPWRRSDHPDLMKRMTQVLMPKGLISPVPDAAAVRAAAAAHRTA